jgi:hypothetical protein
VYGYVTRGILKWAYRLSVVWQSEHDESSTEVCSGTGFFVGAGGQPCLVTNRHLVDPTYGKKRTKKLSKISVCGFDPTGGRFECCADARALRLLYAKNDAEDVVVAVATPGWKSIFGSHMCWVQSDWHTYDDTFSKDVELCDFLTIPGYPEYFDQQNDKPIARMGTIASDPSDHYRGPGQKCARRVAYEAFSTSGNSGGPVLALARGHPRDLRLDVPPYRQAKLLGVNAGHFENRNTRSHEGISYFYRMQVVKDICDEAGLEINC